VKFVHAKLVT